VKRFKIRWLTYSPSGNDKADAFRRAKEFVRRNIDDLVVDVEEETPKRSLIGRMIFGD
jgi:hypothetical protein